MVLRRSICQILSTACLLFLAVPLVAQEVDARLKKEAQALFRVAMADKQAPQACQYDDRWRSSAQFPREYAQEFFGFRLRSNLAAFVPLDAPNKEFVDPEGKYPSAFCSKEDAVKASKDRLEEFKAGTEKSLSIVRDDFSFPIFDAHYTKAVIIRSNSVRNWSVRSVDGVQGGWGSSVTAHGYVKSNGIWREAKDWYIQGGHGPLRSPQQQE